MCATSLFLLFSYFSELYVMRHFGRQILLWAEKEEGHEETEFTPSVSAVLW